MEEYKNLFEYQNFFERFAHVKSHLLCGEENDIQPFVTIIIPTYKRPALLKDAIDSAVNQKGFDDYEVVIVDNDPEQSFKTETQLLVESYQNSKIRYYKHDENIGMFANWNRGVELAKGKWVTLLHDDDYYFCNYLQEMVFIVQSNSHILSLKSKQLSWIDDGSESIKDVEKNFSFSSRPFIRKVRLYDNFFENAVGPTGLFYSKENIISLGGFNVDYYPSSDYVFESNYLLLYNTYIYEKILGVYRWSNNDSLNLKTKESMIIQDYFHRELYRNLIGLKSKFWNGLNRYLIKERTTKFLINYGYKPDKILINLMSNTGSLTLLYKTVYRLFRVNLTMRDRSFVKRLLSKF